MRQAATDGSPGGAGHGNPGSEPQPKEAGARQRPHRRDCRGGRGDQEASSMLAGAPEGATPRICASAGLTAGILQLQQSIERSPEGDDTPDSK